MCIALEHEIFKCKQISTDSFSFNSVVKKKNINFADLNLEP